MTTPLEKIAEEKNGNYQSSLKGGGGLQKSSLLHTRIIVTEKVQTSNVVFYECTTSNTFEILL